MLKNYLLIAARTIWKNKVTAAINMIGLAIGISASLIIYLLVQYDFSFDKFHKDGDRIYRVVSKFDFSGEIYPNSGVTQPLGDAVKKELTGLDNVVTLNKLDHDAKISIPGKKEGTQGIFKKQKDIVFVGENYFRLFEYNWIAGSPASSLVQPYQTVLTESVASSYFPGLKANEIVGREIILDDTVRTTVTGIVKDFSQNSDFIFRTFISKITLEATSMRPGYWGKWDNTTSSSQLLVKLSKGARPEQIEKRLAELYLKHNKPEQGDNCKSYLLLQPLSDIHFNHDYGVFGDRMADKGTLYGLLAIAAFLLLLGCINFINLTTAQASQRAKEIGIRKTMGSSKKQLVFQFLSETFLLTLISTILSVLLTPLLLKIFADFIPEDLHFNLTDQPGILLFLFTLLIIVTIFSGFYPAIVLSGFKPISVLKNQAYQYSSKTRRVWLRKTLTVSQFIIAQVFIMATLLVSKQINYSLNKDLGFRKNAILNLRTNFFDTVPSHRFVLLNKLRSIPEIAMVSLSNNPPSSNSVWSTTQKYKDGKKEIETDVQMKNGDTNYIKLYQLHLLAGRNVEQSDTAKEFIINEKYASILGFRNPQDAIGKYIDWDNKPVPIVGIVADFHQRSLHEPIKPLTISSETNSERNISVLLQQQNAEGTVWKSAIAKIENAWKEVYPDDDFSYSFFDEDIARYYQHEQNISKLLTWAAGLAIFISCLGMFGLVLFITTQRTKEIGVRKVLGASIAQIVAMISKDFVMLVLFAFIIATPLAWIGMNKWLQNFAYRTDISWWIFFLAGIGMTVIALITLGFQTIKTAMINPVKSLRTE